MQLCHFPSFLFLLQSLSYALPLSSLCHPSSQIGSLFGFECINTYTLYNWTCWVQLSELELWCLRALAWISYWLVWAQSPSLWCGDYSSDVWKLNKMACVVSALRRHLMLVSFLPSCLWSFLSTHLPRKPHSARHHLAESCPSLPPFPFPPSLSVLEDEPRFVLELHHHIQPPHSLQFLL